MIDFSRSEWTKKLSVELGYLREEVKSTTQYNIIDSSLFNQSVFISLRAITAFDIDRIIFNIKQ
jgi:hypothetical protein